MVEKKKTNLEGVRVLGVIYFVFASMCLMLAGLAFASFDGARTSTDPLVIEMFATINPGVLIISGILFLAFGVFLYFVGRGLFEMKSWARTSAAILSAMSIILGVSNVSLGAIASGIFSIAISGLIIWYLMVRKETVKAFK